MNIQVEGNKLLWENLGPDRDWFPQHWIMFDSPIKRIEPHGPTVYVECEHDNYIVVDLHSIEQTRVLHEYSHEIPCWMRWDFERFLNSESG